MTKTTASMAVLFLALITMPHAQAQSEITLTPVKDNTLYEDPAGSLSNGAGSRMFTGVTLQPGLRRALLAFDLSAHQAPPDSYITHVTLTLDQVMTISGPQDVSIHRVLRDWGEGSSIAPGQQGAGGPATAGDATWLHTFYDTHWWNVAGGDFEASASAATAVSGNGLYSWSSTGLTADVQQWIDDPSTNFGWVILGNEALPGSAKTFSTREASSGQPTLTIHYESDWVCETPAVSVWGAVALTLVILTVGTALLRRRRSTEAR